MNTLGRARVGRGARSVETTNPVTNKSEEALRNAFSLYTFGDL